MVIVKRNDDTDCGQFHEIPQFFAPGVAQVDDGAVHGDLVADQSEVSVVVEKSLVQFFFFLGHFDDGPSLFTRSNTFCFAFDQLIIVPVDLDTLNVPGLAEKRRQWLKIDKILPDSERRVVIADDLSDG